MKHFRLGIVFLFALMIFILSSCTDPHSVTGPDGTGDIYIAADASHSHAGGSTATPEPEGDPSATPVVSDGETPGSTDNPSVTPKTPGCITTGPQTPSAHVHTFTPATCTAPSTCEQCGVTEGSSLGHNFTAATCTAPSICERCGATEGSALGHNYTGATCTDSGKCTRCGAVSNALGHDFAAATCTAPSTCKRCKITSGSALGHSYSSGKCTRCGDTNGPLTTEEAKFFNNKLTDEENAQALAVAREIVRKIDKAFPNGSDLDRIGMAAELVSDEYYKGVHIEKGNYYNQAYGVFVKRESSCAGCCRALGLVLSCMGYKWTHVNENQWAHQWVTVTVSGETIWADGQIGWSGTGDYPFA